MLNNKNIFLDLFSMFLFEKPKVEIQNNSFTKINAIVCFYLLMKQMLFTLHIIAMLNSI
jgi:hypothetical protein